MPTPQDFTLDINKIVRTNNSVTNALYGLNPSYYEQPLFTDTAYKMHVFFTRPQLNLSDQNCVINNELIKLLTNNRNSIHKYTRMVLDPRLTFKTNTEVTSDIVDIYNPFIPVLSNTLIKMSGWPDIVMATKASKEGHYKEQVVIADGTTDIFNVFDLDLTFKNIQQEPITTIFSIWLEYMDKVHKGHLSPYLDMLIRREIDYMSRIYVIITDETNNVIKKIANIGAGFPITNPMGMFFDYERYGNVRSQVKDINIRFKCIGVEYNQYNSMLDFNTLVAAFHPKMKKLHKGDSKSGMMQVPEELFTLFQNRLYPYIDLATNRLLWYIDEDYVEFIDKEQK